MQATLIMPRTSPFSQEDTQTFVTAVTAQLQQAFPTATVAVERAKVVKPHVRIEDGALVLDTRRTRRA